MKFKSVACRTSNKQQLKIVKMPREVNNNVKSSENTKNALWSLLNCFANSKETSKETKKINKFVEEKKAENGEIVSATLEINVQQCNDKLNISPVKMSISPTIKRNHQVEEETGNKSSLIFEGHFESFDKELIRCRSAPKAHESATKEIRLLSMLANCENAIRYIFLNENQKNFFIITESYQRSLQSCLPEITLPCRDIFRQLSDAVHFLHQRKILHLNVNPQSIRVDNEFQRIKLSDLSCAMELENFDSKIVVEDYIGMKGFVAPELEHEKEASLSSDIFAIGCVLFYILTKGDIIRRINQRTQYSIKIQKTSNKRDSEQILVLELMNKIVCSSSKKRPNIEEIISHPYFWKTDKVFSLILDINKMFEDKSFKDENQAFFDKNSVKVIGNDWKLKLDAELISNSPCKNYDGTSLLDLVRVIRNQLVHRRADSLVAIIGKTDKELIDYFIGKFPQLINHLYQLKKSLCI